MRHGDAEVRAPHAPEWHMWGLWHPGVLRACVRLLWGGGVLMLRRIRHALYQGHQTWKWRHDTDILLRLLEQAEESRSLVRTGEGEQADPWQA